VTERGFMAGNSAGLARLFFEPSCLLDNAKRPESRTMLNRPPATG